MGPELELLLPLLDERARRLVLGAVAWAAGEGGTAAVASVAGASWQTVANGAAELASGDSAAPGRVRRPGAGRKKLADSDPGLVPALRALLEESTRGDPCSPLMWTTLSLRDIAAGLAAQGYRCGKNAVARLLAAQGFSLQGNSRTIEGRRHPDRDAQFRYVNERAKEFLAAGDPVISVDTKKKEPVGQYASRGRSWRPRGEPVRVRDHDFPDPGEGVAIPYGIYDVSANAGFVNVGTDHDTPAFAAESIRRWWQDIGAGRYPGTRRLLVTCDAGGSNDHRKRAWKSELAALAAETGLEITVCHFPPGTSKWNKIEHRLFCHITRTWRARPLLTPGDAAAGIAATVTGQGLKCTAVLDDGDYPTGLKVPPARVKELEDRCLGRGPFRGEWNYALLPVPRPGTPEPVPEPQRPGRVPAGVLNRPALTGTRPQDLAALAEALNGPFEARLAQRNYRLRKGPRVNRARTEAPSGNRRLTLTDHLIALALRRHLKLPGRAISALLGVDESSANRAVALAAELLTAACLTLPAAPPPEDIPRTPGELLGYAAANEIPLTIPENGYPMPERFRTRTNKTTRDTPETAN